MFEKVLEIITRLFSGKTYLETRVEKKGSSILWLQQVYWYST